MERNSEVIVYKQKEPAMWADGTKIKLIVSHVIVFCVKVVFLGKKG